GIVRGHGGMLDVQTAPGKGTSMKVWLPACTGPKMPFARRGVKDLMGNGRILVVDDEDSVRRQAKATLERYGYTGGLAEDGGRAVEFFGNAPDIRLVVLDMAMPGLSGPETLRRLREIRADVPVLVSSGFNDLEAARRYAANGVAGFLQKPYTSVQLAEKVK